VDAASFDGERLRSRALGLETRTLRRRARELCATRRCVTGCASAAIR